MGDTECGRPRGDKIRKAVQWIGEMVREQPDKERQIIVKEAQVRFDLTPNECTFLDKELD